MVQPCDGDPDGADRDHVIVLSDWTDDDLANIYARLEKLSHYYTFNERTGAGDGLSTAEAGIRLRYEIGREFAPYLGIHWERAFGNTVNFRRDEGEDRDDLYFVAAGRMWF